MDSKLVAFRNYDEGSNFYFDDTVEANVWDGDFIMTSGYWVIDGTYSYGDSTGQGGDAESHQIIISGDVKLIMADDSSLTLRYNNDYKVDKDSLTQSITQTVSAAADITVSAVNSATNKKKSSQSKKTETADSSKKTATVDKNAINSLVSGIEGIINSISSANEGTKVATISVNTGNSFSVYGQTESNGTLNIQGTANSSAFNTDEGGAAIGSDGGEVSGTIIFNGGIVKAYSCTSSAAIGGGYGGSDDTAGDCNCITINGGDIYATCLESDDGRQCNGKKGAAIGGSDDGWAKNITINSGHVEAYGNEYGSGIGGGDGHSGDDFKGSYDGITINGGYVLAYGGKEGAGIGSGASAAKGCRDITINNGYVEAHGGDEATDTETPASGIGSGHGCSGSSDDGVTTYHSSRFYFNGGYIYAVAGIECGGEYDDCVSAIGGNTGKDYAAAYIYASTNFSITTSGGTVSNYDGKDLTGDFGGKYYTELKINHIDYDSILNSLNAEEKAAFEANPNCTVSSGKSNVGYYTLNNENGGYVRLTKGMSLTNEGGEEFKNIYVNGDTALGGVIAAEAEGGIINLVDVDFTDNKVIHNSEEAAGGAIYSNGAYDTTLTRCSFTNNMASGYRLRSYGGAIAVTGEALLTIKDTIFKNNKATSEGGAVWNNNNFVISGSDFINGYADKGGAVYAAASETSQTVSKRILNSTFAYNTANFGGALYVEVGSSVSIENSEFTYNNAHSYNYDIESEYIDYGDHQGGAIYVDGDKDARMGGTVVISNTNFTGNYAKQGAGIYVDSYANVAIQYADFIDNFAEDEGGAIYVAQNGTLSLDNVYFSGNTSYISGLVQREKEVTVTTTSSDDSGTSESSVTKYGTYNEEVILTQYCAVYNEGEINITGYVEVDPFCLDVLYNRGRVNWDMNGATANGFFSDITLFTNEITSGSYIGSFGITVNEDDIEGVSRYVIAEHAVFDNMEEDTANTLKRFVLKGVDGELDKVIIADGNTVEYNGKTYRLYTTDAEHYNQLILSVEASETARTSHIVVDREHFNGAVLNTAGEFTDFKYDAKQGGAVLLTEGAVFSAHDSTFSGNEAIAGGAIYAVGGSRVNLTNVTFSGNTAQDSNSGALFIAADATVVMYGDVVLSTASDTIDNYGTLVWNISMSDNGYLSDYSLLNNSKYSSLVIENAPKATYGKYRLADNAKSADGAKFLLSDGESEAITVNSEEWVSCGNMEARIYVDEDKKYSLWLEVRASRIDVNLETYTMRDDYVVDMTGSSSYEGDGGLIYVHSNARLQNEGSVKITGTYATGNGGAVYSEGNINLSHAKFTTNHSYGNGGAIYGKGIKITLTDSTFSGNSSDEGGAIWNQGGTTILDNVTFSNNTAIGDGGAIYGGDIDLRGDVYLSSANDTIWMEDGKTLNWTIDGNDNGYISDFSLIIGNVTASTFTIDAEDAMVGHCYVLAGNAASASGQTVTITVTGADDIEEHTITVGNNLNVNDVCYVLGLNDSNELILSVNQHLVVDYQLLIDSIQDFSWAGMNTYTGNGSIFEIKNEGVMTNKFLEDETTCSYAVSFKDGAVTGNGGIIYNEGSVTLDSAYFEANTAEGNGGAIYSSNCLYVTDSEFFYNEAENGGAVYVAAGTDNLLSGTFYGNTAVEKGGAVYLASGATLTLGDASFSGNEADEGGAIYSEGNILLTGELVLSSSDDIFINMGTLTIDYASDAAIRGYQYLANVDAGKVCISVADLEAGQEIWQYEFAHGDFSGDFEYVDEFILTDGTSEQTITVGGDVVEFNGLNYSVEINETGDALLLNAYTKKNLSITLHDMTKEYDGIAMTCTDYEISGTLESIDDLVFTVSDYIVDAGTKNVEVGSWKVLRDGVDVSNEYDLTSTGCTLTVTPREITITSDSAIKVYDGTPLTCDTIIVTGDGFAEDEGITYYTTGVQDEIGVSKNTFQYQFNEGTKAQNYNITENTGVLAVKAINTADISIVVDNLTKMYDGTSLQATYQYTQGVLADGDELIVMLDCIGITDAGKVDVSVVAYKVMRGDVDVTAGYKFAQIVSGSLEVTQRNISVVTDSAQKLYDGTALTNDTATITGDGFALSEGWDFKVTGTQTEIGISDNTVAYTFNEGTKAQNYNVTVDTGKLKVYAPSEMITITVDNLTKMYDGTALEATYTFTQGILKDGDELVVDLSTDSITNVTENTAVTVTGYKVMRGSEDVTNEYAFADSVAGSLEITKRDITLTSGTKFKTYDGVALVDTTITVSGEDGYVAGEELSYYDFAELNKVGHCWNTFQYGSSNTALVENYNVTVETGILTVYNASDLYVKNSKCINEDMVYTSISIQSDSTLLIEQTATVTTDVLVFNGRDGILATNNGYLTCGDLYVKGSGNDMKGFAANVGQVTIISEADLTVNMDQFDQFIAGASFTDDNKGLLNVITVEDTVLLTQSDIDAVVDKYNLRNIDFQMNLYGINKLTFDASQAKNIAFDDAYGTAKNDTIRFAQKTLVSIGREGKVIDLAAGNNTVQFDKNTMTTIKSDMENVSTVKSASGSVAIMEDIDFQADRNATLKAEGLYFTAGNVTGADKATTITTGTGTAFTAENIELGTSNDKITVGKDGTFNASEVLFGSGNDTFSIGSRSVAEIDGTLDNVNKLTLSNGSYAKKTAETSYTKLSAAGIVTGTSKNDSFNAGNYSDVNLVGGINFYDGNDTLKIGADSNFSAGAMEFGDGNDKLSVGKNSTFNAASISDAETLEFAAYSKAEIAGDITGVKKLTVANGKEGKVATLKATDVTGTKANDTFNLGNWNEITLDSLCLDDGNDTLIIGSQAKVEIGVLNFGDGAKDRMTIGKGATLSVDTLDWEGLDTLVMGKDSYLQIADTEDLKKAQEKWSKYSDRIISKIA